MYRRRNFTAQIVEKHNSLYYLRYTTADYNVSEYYFVDVLPEKEDEFLSALRNANKYTLEEYGTIISCGYGQPSDDYRQSLQEKYTGLCEAS